MPSHRPCNCKAGLQSGYSSDAGVCVCLDTLDRKCDRLVLSLGLELNDLRNAAMSIDVRGGGGEDDLGGHVWLLSLSLVVEEVVAEEETPKGSCRSCKL